MRLVFSKRLVKALGRWDESAHGEGAKLIWDNVLGHTCGIRIPVSRSNPFVGVYGAIDYEDRMGFGDWWFGVQTRKLRPFVATSPTARSLIADDIRDPFAPDAETRRWEEALTKSARNSPLPGIATSIPSTQSNTLVPDGEWTTSLICAGWSYVINAYREHAGNVDALHDEFRKIAPRMLAFVRPPQPDAARDGFEPPPRFGAVPIAQFFTTKSAFVAAAGWEDHTWPNGKNTLSITLR